jgi:hypothetical protein
MLVKVNQAFELHQAAAGLKTDLIIERAFLLDYRK